MSKMKMGDVANSSMNYLFLRDVFKGDQFPGHVKDEFSHWLEHLVKTIKRMEPESYEQAEIDTFYDCVYQELDEGEYCDLNEAADKIARYCEEYLELCDDDIEFVTDFYHQICLDILEREQTRE